MCTVYCVHVRRLCQMPVLKNDLSNEAVDVTLSLVAHQANTSIVHDGKPRLRTHDKKILFSLVKCINSFIHSGDLLHKGLEPFQDTILLRVAPRSVISKVETSERCKMIKFGRVGHTQGTQFKGEIIPC